MSGGKASRDKGIRGELEWWKHVKAIAPDQDVSRKLTSTRAGGDDGRLFDVSIEVKRSRHARFGSWLRQLDEQTPDGTMSALAYRLDRESWKILLRLDSLQFVRVARYLRDNPE